LSEGVVTQEEELGQQLLAQGTPTQQQLADALSSYTPQ